MCYNAGMVLDHAAGPASIQDSRDVVGDHKQRIGQEYWIMLQALHLFKKAEILLETMNKELDKSRVMSNRPPRSGAPLQRTSSISLGMAQTPGPTLVPVSRVRHARYKGTCICTLCAGASLVFVNPLVYSPALSAVHVLFPERYTSLATNQLLRLAYLGANALKPEHEVHAEATMPPELHLL